MSTTRAFKSGNSQAVRIPAELAFADPAIELTVTRTGDVITIFPVRSDLHHAVGLLRQMERPEGSQPRDAIELPDRDWD